MCEWFDMKSNEIILKSFIILHDIMCNYIICSMTISRSCKDNQFFLCAALWESLLWYLTLADFLNLYYL